MAASLASIVAKGVVVVLLAFLPAVVLYLTLEGFIVAPRSHTRPHHMGAWRRPPMPTRMPMQP